MGWRRSRISVERQEHGPARPRLEGGCTPRPGALGWAAGDPLMLGDARLALPANARVRAALLHAGQQALGNGMVRSLAERGPAALQAKLVVSPPGDIYEQEADRVAETVLRMPAAPLPHREAAVEEEIQPGYLSAPVRLRLQRQEEDEEEEPLQTQALTGTGSPHLQRQAEEEEEPVQTVPLRGAVQAAGGVPQVTPELEERIARLRGGGRPLAQSERAFFEPRFGLDFAGVRVHTGAEAATVASALQARAFTVGRDIVFGAGHYAPETAVGRGLLAHELTHVVQQAELPVLTQRMPFARTGRTALQRWGEGEVDTAMIEEAVAAVSRVTAASVRGMDRGELTRLRDLLTCTLETAFSASGSLNYRYLLEQRDLIAGELERRDVEQAHQDIIDQVRLLSTTWRDVLRQELAAMGATDVEDWALEAIGSFVGLPYMNAHELYGGPDAWRAAYQRSGVYPPAVVCDQLGELTQRLARGVAGYGPPGLTGHYAFYQANDAAFPTVPATTSDPRCAPGATLFHTAGITWNFREQASGLYADLYQSGIPKASCNWGEINAVRQRAQDLNRLLRGRWSGDRGKANLLAELDRLPGRARWAAFASEIARLRREVEQAPAENVAGLLRVFAESIYADGERTLSLHFEPDRKLTHEYTLVARVESAPGGRLLLLDTWGPQGSGTMQVRPSTLSREGGSLWGFFSPPRSRRIPIYTPYSGVSLRLRGTGGEHTFDDIWLQSPVPPPIVFRYALQSVPLPGLSAYLDFFMQGRRCETLLVGTLAVRGGEARFTRPAWMTERVERRRTAR